MLLRVTLCVTRPSITRSLTLTAPLDRGPREPVRQIKKPPKLKPTTREWTRRSGPKRFNFNPNYYPQFHGRDPLTKFMPPGSKYVNPKDPNNGPNVPKFKNWSSSYMIRRVIDPVHGEKFVYPNEACFEYDGEDLDTAKWPDYSTHKWDKTDIHKISIHNFQHDEANYENRKRVVMKPIPNEMNYSPFQCPKMQLILRELAKFDKRHNRRDILDNIAQEIRYRQVGEYARRQAKYYQMRDEMEQMEKHMRKNPDDAKMSHKLFLFRPEFERLIFTMNDFEKDPYKFITKAVDRLKPAVDFAMVARSPTEKIPIPKPINERRAVRFAVRWIHESAMLYDKNRKYCTTTGRYAGKDLRPKYLRYVDELYDALDKKGYAYNKKLAHHKIAEAQKAYSQLFW